MDSKSEQFSLIYDQYIDKIYRFVYLKVNSQDVAEDIVSKTFTRGWEAFCSHKDGIKNPGAFLYQIARNAVVDHYRQKDRQKAFSVTASQEIADNKANAQDLAMLSADVELVRKAIQKLGREHQDIIIWHYLDDMEIGQIAELLGRPEGTVRVMLHRGLKELKDLVQQS